MNGARTDGAQNVSGDTGSGFVRAPNPYPKLLYADVRGGFAFRVWSDEPSVIQMSRTIPDHVCDSEPA